MMNHPSLHSIPRPDAPDEEMFPPSQPKRPSGFWRRLWKGWLWLTSPHPGHFSPDLAGQEYKRRSQMMSVLLLLLLGVIVLVVFDTLTQPRLVVSLGVDVGFGLLAALLNRAGQVTLAGLTFIALVDLGVSAAVLNNPTGLSSLAPSTFCLYLIAVLNAGVVLSRLWIVVIGFIQIGLMLTLFNMLPFDTSLKLLINTNYNGQSYPVLVPPILLIMCTTTIVWLYAASVQRALLRASRAEELAEARARLQEQSRQIGEQKQRLEQGINMLQEVHARLANGEYTARVNLQGNELLPLGVSLNLLAERLGRGGRVQQDYQRLEEAIQQLMKACAALTRGNFPVTLPPTGTAVDQAASFLTWVQNVVTHTAQGSTMAEDLQAVLQHQEGYLAQAESSLFNLRSLVNSGMGDAFELHAPTRSGPLGDRLSQSQPEPALLRLRSLLEQQQALCEQLTQECAQAHQLGRRCIQGTRLLSSQLKEGLRMRSAGGMVSGPL
ncbi:MAG TPA: hypothetical protein VFU69_16525 [Ktedonobacterales bacterium]|nr:hypothetical protein [Ktedonobacterales bacterium]